MTKNNKQDEPIEVLSRWSKEDEKTRSVLIIADEENGTRFLYNGTKLNLVAALVATMRTDDNLRRVFADAMILLEDYEASITNDQDDDDKE